MMTAKETITNIKLTIAGLLFSVDSFVVIESAGLRMNICAEKPAYRKSVKHLSYQNHTISR